MSSTMIPLRSLLRALVPTARRRLCAERRKSPYVWDGIYRTFDEVPVAGAGFDGDVWIRQTLVSTRRLQETPTRWPSPSDADGLHDLLALLVATVGSRSGRVRLLDFGGGMGTAYVSLRRRVGACVALEYHVVERAAVADEGGWLHASDPAIWFHHAFPEVPSVDVVYLNSSLQYVDDYRGLLRALSRYRAPYWLLADVPAGRIPTYVTGQRNVSGSVIPYRFFDLDELVEAVSGCGYRLVFSAPTGREYNQDNFPADYQLGRACTSLFVATPTGVGP